MEPDSQGTMNIDTNTHTTKETQWIWILFVPNVFVISHPIFYSNLHKSNHYITRHDIPYHTIPYRQAVSFVEVEIT